MTKLHSLLSLVTFIMLIFFIVASGAFAKPTQEKPRDWFIEFCGTQGEDSAKVCGCYADFLESNLNESEFRALTAELKNHLLLDQDEALKNITRALESKTLVNAKVTDIFVTTFAHEECIALEPSGRDYLARQALHNLYLSCKAFWADHGSDAQCTLNEPSDDEYGHFPSDNIALSISGNEYDFKAQSKHRFSDTAYEITADGEIKEIGTR